MTKFVPRVFYLLHFNYLFTWNKFWDLLAFFCYISEYRSLKFGVEESSENVIAGTAAKGIPFGCIAKLALSETEFLFWKNIM